MSIPTILLLIALILFVIDAIGVATRVNLTAAGLAFVTLSMLVGGMVLR